MTPRELRTRLNAMTDAEFAAFRKQFGGDHNDREGYVQWFHGHPQFDSRLSDILDLPSETEKRTGVSVTQHIHGAQVVAGNVQGNLNVQITISEILQAIEKQIEEDTSLPEPEKKGLLQKLKDFAYNPYVSNLVTNLLYDGGKLAIDLATRK